MKKLLITENEKNRIKRLYGLITEQETGFCTAFNEESKTLIFDYDKIVESFSSSTDTLETVLSKINDEINTKAQKYKESGIPERTSCQMGLIQIRPGFKDKNVIVVDTKNHTIMIFDKDGNFIAKDVVLSGSNPQASGEMKDYVNMSAPERKEFLSKLLNKPINDITDKFVLDYEGGKSLNPAIYKTKEFTNWEKYGEGKNLGYLFGLNDETFSQALHSSVPTEKRLDALNKASKLIGSYTSSTVSDEYYKNVEGIDLTQSAGCLNLNPDFVKEYVSNLENAYVFNISESDENYYVKNITPLINEPDMCHSPQSLGGMTADNIG
jgi:hypothetical protein